MGDEDNQDRCEDPTAPLLPVTTPGVEAALKRIMADCGFSVEQIRRRFPDLPRSDKPRAAATNRMIQGPKTTNRAR